jgi:L-threonylcarbamoyladenylate synthase
VLKAGGIILYPTDTVWGIGCDATRGDAVERVYKLKRRVDHKAMLVLLGDSAMIDRYIDTVPDAAAQLLDVATKPLTIIYDHGRNLAPGLLGPDGSVGIRVTAEAFSRDLCRGLRRPLVSTSANISGEPAARRFADISPEIIAGVDYVVNYRRDEPASAAPSSIIKVGDDNSFKILRP